jgi:hypothetical protein
MHTYLPAGEKTASFRTEYRWNRSFIENRLSILFGDLSSSHKSVNRNRISNNDHSSKLSNNELYGAEAFIPEAHGRSDDQEIALFLWSAKVDCRLHKIVATELCLKQSEFSPHPLTPFPYGPSSYQNAIYNSVLNQGSIFTCSI